MRRKYKLVADRPTFPPEKDCDFKQFDADAQQESIVAGAGSKGNLWGWKGPRSIYFLPFYQAVFNDNFRSDVFLLIIFRGFVSFRFVSSRLVLTSFHFV
jgi:hypothetical protein